LYNFATVVDDADMRISHVVRAEEHLSNTFPQLLLFEALGVAPPQFAHVPFVAEPGSKKKLSKRADYKDRNIKIYLNEYADEGYLPEAMLNYLARLGWSHGDDEIMSTEDMVRWFEIEDINKGAARFDFQKLEALNGVHMRQMDDAELLDTLLATLPYLTDSKLLQEQVDEARKAQLLAAMPGLKERAKTLVELADGALFLFAERPIAPDEKAAALLDDGARTMLRDLAEKLAELSDWSAQSTEMAVKAFAENAGVKLGKVAQPLRAALTGRTTSPGIFDVLAVLGRDESLARLRDQALA
jgi:glutamyl-tRNA synthetase